MKSNAMIAAQITVTSIVFSYAERVPDGLERLVDGRHRAARGVVGARVGRVVVLHVGQRGPAFISFSM